MRLLTRSKRIRSALKTAFHRLSPKDRTKVEDFLSRIVAHREWTPLRLSGFDPASAMVAPFFLSIADLKSKKYGCQLVFHLPVARLFSRKALIGIVAHELAHVHIAATLGEGWYEQMKRRERAHERRADRLADSWGFTAEIARVYEERVKRVNPILDKRESYIMKRIGRTWAPKRSELKLLK
jgi:hypothetical protein